MNETDASTDRAQKLCKLKFLMWDLKFSLESVSRLCLLGTNNTLFVNGYKHWVISCLHMQVFIPKMETTCSFKTVVPNHQITLSPKSHKTMILKFSDCKKFVVYRYTSISTTEKMEASWKSPSLTEKERYTAQISPVFPFTLSINVKQKIKKCVCVCVCLCEPVLGGGWGGGIQTK
jgi:hypothetical protein